MQTKFLVVIPFHNVKPYIGECANSLMSQRYRHWRAILSDDASDDDSARYIPTDGRFTIRRSERRMTALANIHHSIVSSSPSDDDVICILDGDDHLIRPDALDILSAIYSDPTAMLSYGQYVNSNGGIGHCRALPSEAFGVLRRIGFWTSHMRTFRYALYRELMRQDPGLTCYRDAGGEMYTMCADVATMIPLLEIAGHDRVRFNPHPIYYYRQHPQNDHAKDQSMQKRMEIEIFSKKPFDRLK